MTLDYGVEPPLPIAQMGLLRPPGEGGAAGDRESEGELGSSLALPAVAGTNSLHFLLILVPQEAWALGRRAPREDPSCACRPATSPCCLTWPTEPTPTPAKSPKSRRPVVELGFCLRYVLMSPEGTTRRPLPSDPQCPLGGTRLKHDHSHSLQQ